MVKLESNPFAHLTEYELRHLVGHLVAANKLKDALSIIKPEFREAKYRRFASDSAFVQDLEIIIDKLEEAGQSDGLPATMRCSLIRSLFTSLTLQIPPEVLSALVHFGEGDRAIQMATLSPTSEEKARQLLAIAKAHRQSGAPTETISHTLQEALRITRSLTRVAEGTLDLLRIQIASQAVHLNWDWSQQILEEIEYPYIRSQSRIAIAAEIADDQTKAVGLLQEVLPTVSDESPLTWDLSDALGEVAKYHLDDVQTLIGFVENRQLQDLIRREVARHLLEGDRGHSALRIAGKIADSRERLAVLGLIAGSLAKKDLAEARKIVDQIPSTREGVRALLDLVNSLSPEHAEYALEISITIPTANDRCRALAQAALLFAKVHDIPQTRMVLRKALDAVHCLSTSDVSHLFLSIVVGEAIAEVALVDEKAAIEMLAEWELQEYGQHVVSQVCELVLEHNVNLALRLSELLTHPYLKDTLLVRAIFYLPSNDPRIEALQKQVTDSTKAMPDSRHKLQLQAYLIVSRGIDSPERLLSILKEEAEPSNKETELPTTITIGPSGVDYSTRDRKERDGFLIDLALDVSHRDVDQALVVLQGVLDKKRRSSGLARLACLLSRRARTVGTGEDQAPCFRRRNSLTGDLSAAAAQLARNDIQLALKIVEAISDRSEQARAYAAVVLAIRDRDFRQGQLLLERALAVGQIRPRSALRAIAYLELDRCIPGGSQKGELVEKSLSLLPSDTIPAAVPEITRHIVTHLAAKGKEEIALRIAEEMPTTHAILDTPDKMRALIGIAEHALEHRKLDVGKRALDEALYVLRLSPYCSPSLPRLASLMRHYDSKLADQLFDIAIKAAMSREMHGPSRFHILGGVAYFQAPFNIRTALDAARRISDPCIRADALMSTVIRSNMPLDRREEIISEIKELLTADHGSAIAKARALLKLADTRTPECPGYRELLGDIVETARLAQPADWLKRIGLLIEVYRRYKELGDQEDAAEVVSEALDTARDDPFNWSVDMAQVAALHLGSEHSTAISILYEILQIARLGGYDAVWKAITAIIPVLCKIGGSELAQHVYQELAIAEGFIPLEPDGLASILIGLEGTDPPLTTRLERLGP